MLPEPPGAIGPPLPIRPITLSSPWRWLALGWADFARRPGPGLVHGAVLALFGGVLFMLAYDRFWALAGAFSGFLLLAPILATGLYAISRALERGERVDVHTVLGVWRPHDLRLVTFGLLLALAGTGWVMTSAALITLFADAPVRNPQDFLRVVVLARDSMLFEAWLALGGLLAAPVYASSVVAIPLLLDREIGLWRAVLTSWRAALEHPLPLALWAAILMLTSSAAITVGLVGPTHRRCPKRVERTCSVSTRSRSRGSA
ncbi:MAG: DUF2189 domain-containing protein [Burkholderiaceae bacterium]|nr:DUF2189 domain-containing protein [Burkholderiaceae bacterium]